MSKELEALSALRSTINLADYQDSGQYYDKMKWLNTIEQALARNEPMKVMLKNKGFEHYDAYCPKCKEYVGFKNSVRESLALNYCPNCGQNLDWNK